MKRILIFMALLCSCIAGKSQITQTVRGKVVDQATKFPLIGATVAYVNDGDVKMGVITDAQGKFRMDEIPVGRQNFKVQYVGYQEVVLNNIIVSSSKETILNVEMQESSVGLNEVTVTTKRDGEVNNEMATVSAREFSVDETNRYAGSRGDPARMASNFAGVQGADDSRNDIVIRGNSPQSVIWQVDGVIIPNPNHFAIPGTNGGPASIINFKTIDNSDFYTGAFPAEFGNSTAGVFDLNLRSGNNQKHEYSGMFGLLGIEAFGEGPINKEKGSSYLVNYRYSTISLFLAMGVDVGTNSAPIYQDLTFKFNFPQKNGADLSLWGIGGMSSTDILISTQTEPVQELYGQSDRDQYFESNMGVLGMTYSYPINKNTFWKTSLAASRQRVNANHDLIIKRDTLPDNTFDPSTVEVTPLLGYTFDETKYTLSTQVYKKLKPGSILKYGLMADMYDLSYHDSLRVEDSNWPNSQNYQSRWNTDDIAFLIQPYLQWKYNLTESFSANIGWHGTFFSLSNSYSLFEPRLGFKWAVGSGQSINFGTGLHSQIQAPYLYYYSDPLVAQREGKNYNVDMDLTKSWHFVLGYNRMLGKNMRMKTEAYYQHLFNIPVEANYNSSFSLVNTGSGFSRFFPNELENTGTGFNYGLELTLERFFSNNYFYMITASLYESKYRGSDGIVRNTDFNGNYMINALGTKEFNVTDNAVFGIGPKITYAGGRRYGLVDSTASENAQEVIWLDRQRNEFRFPDYFRADMRITYKINRPKVTHEIALDAVNFLGIENILNIAWAPGINPQTPFAYSYQIGFLPVFYYKMDF